MDLDKATIFLALAGSRAYGIHTDESDYDICGIAIPPLACYANPYNKFAHWNDPEEINKIQVLAQSFPNGCDGAILEVGKFIKLASDCNPSIIEQLFSPSKNFIRCTPAAEKIIENRQKFLNKRILYSFASYAAAQMKRMVSHHAWGQRAVTAPERASFGLGVLSKAEQHRINQIKSSVRKKVDSWEPNLQSVESKAERLKLLDELSQIIQDVRITEDSLQDLAVAAVTPKMVSTEAVKAELAYDKAVSKYKSYLKWKTNRNPKRAILEEKYGFDLKHSVHMIRLMRMCEEIATTGIVHTDRTGIDAEELVAIRNGAWTLEQVKEYFVKAKARIDELIQENQALLPDHPDDEFAEKLVYEVIEEYLK